MPDKATKIQNKEYYRRYRELNRLKIRAKQRAWYLANKDSSKLATQKYVDSGKAALAYTARVNKDPGRYKKRALERAYKFKAANFDRYRLHQRNYQNMRRVLGGNIDDQSNIIKVYSNCPTDMEVDHVIPINNKNVCGLHVSWNMQYLNRSDNATKSNKFDGTYSNNSWRLMYEAA